MSGPAGGESSPVRFLNYPGRVDPVGQVMGPNMFGEYLTAVTADYDPETNKTRVGFRYTRKGDPWE